MAAHCFPLQNFEVWSYEGDGEFSLYEDSEGKTCVTIFKMTHTRGKQVLEIFTKGDPSFLPINRVVTLFAVYKTVCGAVTEEVPASVLQLHPNCILIVDKEAANKL